MLCLVKLLVTNESKFLLGKLANVSFNKSYFRGMRRGRCNNYQNPSDGKIICKM